MNVVGAGRALLLAEAPLYEPHLWFVLTDPEGNPPRVVAVMMRTVTKFTDPTVVLKPDVAVFRETGIDHGLQDLQHGLLDEPVEHGRDAQLPHPTARLRNLTSLHHARLVATREQLLPDRWPVVAKIGAKIVHRPAIHAGAPLIPPHALEGAQQIPPLDNPLH